MTERERDGKVFTVGATVFSRIVELASTRWQAVPAAAAKRTPITTTPHWYYKQHPLPLNEKCGRSCFET
jgi:hypothetical protein